MIKLPKKPLEFHIAPKNKENPNLTGCSSCYCLDKCQENNSICVPFEDDMQQETES